MANGPTTPAAATPAPKKSKRMFVIGGAVAGLVLAGGGALMFIKSRQDTGDDEDDVSASKVSGTKKKALSSDAISKAEEARVWVQYERVSANLLAGSGILQATVDVQVSDAHVKEKLDKARPLVLSKILDLFSALDYDGISSAETKGLLAQKIKLEINAILGAEANSPEVNQVVFSSYIAQAT